VSEIVCVVDRSGSMSSVRDDAIGGFNSFLESQRAVPGEARLTLVLFDHEYGVLHEGVPLEAVPPLDDNSYVPRGMTALLDAVGRTIDDVGKRLSDTPEVDRPEKVIVSILTDGYENASHDYSYDRVSEMIRHQREKYGWEFVFLAANQDAIASASALSIDAADALSFQATPDGVRAGYASLNLHLADKRARFLRRSKGG
jgi:hypothetical protein